MSKKVAVAMSGGLDSSYALIKLKKEGYSVFGVTLKLFCYADRPASPSSCCSIDAVRHARGICKSLGVPHYVIDGEEVFGKEVIDYFIKAYKRGLTPNPCVVCNRKIKWGYLLDKAEEYGAEFIATGHYARSSYWEEKKRYLLKCGLDREKDQAYYLWPLDQKQLSRTLFPLGEMTKREVRKDMENYDIKIARKSESQEICFIPDDDYRGFLRESGEVKVLEGNILSSSGEILGTHKGYPFYTVGQRRGLGVSSKGRLYVKSIDIEKNEVILGKYEELYRKEVLFSGGNFISYEVPPEDKLFEGRIRYRGKAEQCKIKKVDEEKFLLTFINPVWGVSPGQSVVIYEGDCVVGGGVICG